MKRELSVSILLLAAACCVFAGITVNEKSQGWRIGTESTAFRNLAECMEAAKAKGPGAYPCNYSTLVTVTATCDDVPMPEFPTVVNADGFRERPGVVVKQLPNSELWGPTMQEGFVMGPGYPDCWVPGLVPYKGEVPAPDGPPSAEVGPWVYTSDKEWPIGGKCPAQKNGLNDPSLCYSPPNPPIPPAP